MSLRVQGSISRAARVGLLLLALLTVGAAGFWAGRVALTPPDDPLSETGEPVTYSVVEQTLGQSLQFAAVAEWEAMPLGRAWSSGIVTSVTVEAGQAVAAGDVVFSVDLRPVVIAIGEVPAFRDLIAGDTGVDVAQLQTMLDELGFLDESPNATFGPTTTAAVRAWQRSLGVADDGVVRQGDVLFAPSLPVRVVPTEALFVGAPLSGGEVVVQRLAAEPSITIPLTTDQRNLVPLSAAVRLTHPAGTWEGVIVRVSESSEEGFDQLDLVLAAPDGGPICGETCSNAIPVIGRTNLPAEVAITPEATGPVVPTAAITTDPSGGHSVELADGTVVPVEIVASAGGLAVVSGVEVGDVLRLPFAAPPEG